jgi:hypothetical protein
MQHSQQQTEAGAVTGRGPEVFPKGFQGEGGRLKNFRRIFQAPAGAGVGCSCEQNSRAAADVSLHTQQLNSTDKRREGVGRYMLLLMPNEEKRTDCMAWRSMSH